ncbi:MAG: DUF4364 family protein [Lachnospiraceae bacterium]|nr:DUF4364 family protein [Lachnospiraceae bacterium]
MTEPLTLYKLMVLYMLNQVQFPLTNSQMLSFFLDNEYTDYFTFQQAINELVDAGLILTESRHNSSHYTITEAGGETLSYFSSSISQAIIDEMDDFLRENHVKLRNESGITSEYYKSGQEYTVRCQVKEGRNLLFALEVSVPNKEQAIAVCNNWAKSSQDIYSFAVKSLFK